MHTHVKAKLTFASEKLRTNNLIVFNSRSQKTITRDHYFGKWADGRINNLDLIPFLHAVNTVYTCIITNLNSDSPLVAKVREESEKFPMKKILKNYCTKICNEEDFKQITAPKFPIEEIGKSESLYAVRPFIHTIR